MIIGIPLIVKFNAKKFIMNIASWSSGVLASLSHWRSRVQIPSKLPDSKKGGFLPMIVLAESNLEDTPPERLGSWA